MIRLDQARSDGKCTHVFGNRLLGSIGDQFFEPRKKCEATPPTTDSSSSSTRSDPIRSGQTRPDQTRPDQTRSDQIRPDQARSVQISPDQRPDQTRSDHIRSDGICALTCLGTNCFGFVSRFLCNRHEKVAA